MVLQLILLSCHFHFVREKLTNAAMIYYLRTGEAAKILGLDMVVVCKYVPVLLMNRIIIVCLKYGALTRIFAVKLFCHTHISESNASDWESWKCLLKNLGKYFYHSCISNSTEIKIEFEIKVKVF